MSFSTKFASLYHVDQCRLELKRSTSYSTVGPVGILSGVDAEYSRRDLFSITLTWVLSFTLLNLPRQKGLRIRRPRL
jgi:hypothetical protein